MKNYIKNKTALITGASSGIGRRLAFDLANMGLNLVLVSRDYDKLEQIKKELQNTIDTKIDIYALDIRNIQEVKVVFKTILQNTTVDILVNNAGLALGYEPIDQGNTDSWEEMIDTNIKGLLYVSRQVIPSMRKLDTAHIVNIGSVAGKMSYANAAVYCATKAAVHSLGASINADFFGTNIKATTIAPGAVETNFSYIRYAGDKAKAQAVYDGYKPLSASDISSAIVCVLNTPPHVNIQYVDIMPTAQRNPYMLHRDNQ
jgi:NADP-dependent 3-hydroxy acid dehydrogenase YdfG